MFAAPKVLSEYFGKAFDFAVSHLPVSVLCIIFYNVLGVRKHYFVTILLLERRDLHLYHNHLTVSNSGISLPLNQSHLTRLA